MIRSLISLIVFGVLLYACTAIGIGQAKTDAGWPWGADGKETVLGHIRGIWHSDQAQDLKNGIEDKAAPAADKVREKVHDMTGSGS